LEVHCISRLIWAALQCGASGRVPPATIYRQLGAAAVGRRPTGDWESQEWENGRNRQVESSSWGTLHIQIASTMCFFFFFFCTTAHWTTKLLIIYIFLFFRGLAGLGQQPGRPPPPPGRGVPSRAHNRPWWKRLLVVHRTASSENLAWEWDEHQVSLPTA